MQGVTINDFTSIRPVVHSRGILYYNDLARRIVIRRHATVRVIHDAQIGRHPHGGANTMAGRQPHHHKPFDAEISNHVFQVCPNEGRVDVLGPD
ncbi:hypothetical protein RRF57_009547 [Xylaria bambusicola]|uniref:Uncharacterized protein n=1 Tax=Xylaria bambusicola TaxID=326684 RepID=A0AAN7ZC07_9PEZI